MADENVNMNEDPWNVTSSGAEKEEMPVQTLPYLEPDGNAENASGTENSVNSSESKNEAVSELRDDFALVSMVCGIISLFTMFGASGILALVFAFLSKRGGHRNSRSTVGLVCSIVSFVFSILIWMVLFGTFVAAVFANIKNGTGFHFYKKFTF